MLVPTKGAPSTASRVVFAQLVESQKCERKRCSEHDEEDHCADRKDPTLTDGKQGDHRARPRGLSNAPSPRIEGTHRPTYSPRIRSGSPITPNHSDTDKPKETNAAAKMVRTEFYAESFMRTHFVEVGTTRVGVGELERASS